MADMTEHDRTTGLRDLAREQLVHLDDRDRGNVLAFLLGYAPEEVLVAMHWWAESTSP